jgi:hypothetical protein
MRQALKAAAQPANTHDNARKTHCEEAFVELDD